MYSPRHMLKACLPRISLRGLIFDRAGELFVARIPPSASGDILKFTRTGAPDCLCFRDWRSGRKWWPEYLAIQP